VLEIHWTGYLESFARGIFSGQNAVKSFVRFLERRKGMLKVLMMLEIKNMNRMKNFILNFLMGFQGESEEIQYPGWAMGFALFLVILGIVPIIAIYIMNKFNLHTPSGRAPDAATTMRRIDTAASTRPMMDDYEVKCGQSERPWYRHWC